MHSLEAPHLAPLYLSMMVAPELQRYEDPHRHHLHQLRSRPRPAGRLRRSAASVLVRVAARLANEPVAALPRRA